MGKHHYFIVSHIAMSRGTYILHTKIILPYPVGISGISAEITNLKKKVITNTIQLFLYTWRIISRFSMFCNKGALISRFTPF